MLKNKKPPRRVAEVEVWLERHVGLADGGAAAGVALLAQARAWMAEQGITGKVVELPDPDPSELPF